MEFRFNLNQLMRTPIVKINNSLIPNGFHGDRRAALEATAKVSEIINTVGEESARAQGLSKPVTTSEKLRNSDHIIYILSEQNGKTGLVTGLLKVGQKSLYVHDVDGNTRNITAPCVLDFYVHESRQRAGFGKLMFEYMLNDENIAPEKLAIDRPSEKLLGFLRKHYGLSKSIPQMNNFVVYEGFFDPEPQRNGGDDLSHRRMHISASPNTNLFGPQFTVERNNRRTNSISHMNDIPSQLIQPTKVGRYAATKPSSSMSQIIHNTPAVMRTEPTSTNNSYFVNADHHANRDDDDGHEDEMPHNDHHHHHHHHPHHEQEDEEIEESILAHKINNLQLTLNVPSVVEDEPESHEQRTTKVKFEQHDDEVDHHQNQHHHSQQHNQTQNDGVEILRKPVLFQHSKQHTGLKNISHNVGLAVSPSNKMEFNQEVNEGFGSVKINRPIGTRSHRNGSQDHLNDTESVSSRESDSSRLTEQGYLDLKFYHNKLW